MILFSNWRILMMLIYYCWPNLSLAFYFFFFFFFQRWFSWWLPQRLGETWRTSRLEMLSSWEMFMKYILSSPREKSLSVRDITKKVGGDFMGIGTSGHAAFTPLLSCQRCLCWALTVNYIMDRNGDNISRCWDCGTPEAHTAHGGCPCWRHFRDSMHK